MVVTAIRCRDTSAVPFFSGHKMVARLMPPTRLLQARQNLTGPTALACFGQNEDVSGGRGEVANELPGPGRAGATSAVSDVERGNPHGVPMITEPAPCNVSGQ